MKKSYIGGISVVLVVVSIGTLSAQEPEVRRMIVNFTETPPAIDGVMTSVGEWAEASIPGAEWTLLNSLNNAAPDPTNNRFQALWNFDGLYLLHEVDHGQWANRGVGRYEFSYETTVLYIDPNVDNEPNNVSPAHVDGFRLAYNMPLGESEITPEMQTAGFISDARVNALFGNNAGSFSGFANMVLRQTTSVDPPFGYTELFIPWSDFDATNPETGNFPETGLFHPSPPVDGEEWYFNIARIQDDNSSPSWSLAPSANFFPERPHGVLEFQGGSLINPGDLNQDGVCDALDIDVLTRAIIDGIDEARFDFTEDGVVNRDDRTFYIEQVKHTFVGDSNLDGEFNSRDFVTVFQRNEYEDGIPGNSGWAEGDWDGDLDFGTRDFVAAFQSGAYEQGPRAAVVPEPSGMLLCSGMLVMFSLFRRRTRMSACFANKKSGLTRSRHSPKGKSSDG